MQACGSACVGGKLHLLLGIAVIRAWRYETASTYDRQHSDRQQLDLEREDYFRMRMLMCVLSRMRLTFRRLMSTTVDVPHR